MGRKTSRKMHVLGGKMEAHAEILQKGCSGNGVISEKGWADSF